MIKRMIKETVIKIKNRNYSQYLHDSKIK